MTRDRRSGDRADRFGVFPFSMGCISHSAVSVVEQQQKNPQNEVPSTTPSAEDDGGAKVRGASTSPGIVATGVQRLIKGLKSLSQMFAVYEEEEEEEREMVIGFPTDVKHVGHIGWDGFNKDGGVGMVDAFSMQPSTLSLRQLEMAMEAHACTT